MPLRRYSAVKPGRCPLCREGFEYCLRADEPALAECPRCGGALTAETNTVNSPKILRPIGTVEAKDAGFVVMERNKHGLYEKK